MRDVDVDLGLNERSIDGERRRRMTTTLCSMGSNQMNGILIEIDESNIFAAYERD